MAQRKKKNISPQEDFLAVGLRMVPAGIESLIRCGITTHHHNGPRKHADVRSPSRTSSVFSTLMVFYILSSRLSPAHIFVHVIRIYLTTIGLQLHLEVFD